MPTSTALSVCVDCNTQFQIDTTKSITHCVIGGFIFLFLFGTFAFIFNIDENSLLFVKIVFVLAFLFAITLSYRFWRKHWLVYE